MDILKINSRGDLVVHLQKKLASLGYKLSPDGIFGKATQEAVIHFQRQNGLTSDGIVGELTWSMLDSKTSSIGKTRTISQNGINFIKSFEGLRLRAYDDGVGVITIGYGTTRYPNGHKVQLGDTCTEKQAEQYLANDLVKFEKAVNELVKVPVNQNQYDALVSFTYNVGVGALSTSTVLKLLNAGDYTGCAKAMLSWNKGRVGGKLVEIGGLTRRRNAEKDLFLK